MIDYIDPPNRTTNLAETLAVAVANAGLTTVAGIADDEWETPARRIVAVATLGEIGLPEELSPLA